MKRLFKNLNDLFRFSNIFSLLMIKEIIRAIYSAFISVLLILIVLAGWTGYTFISQPTKSSEIIDVIRDIYESQKSVIINVVDLSKLLINDTSNKIASETIKLSPQAELLTDLEDRSQADESLISQDNGDNPLRIVIEPTFPEIIEEPSVNERNELSMNEVEMEMN